MTDTRVPQHPARNRLAAETSPYLLQHAGNPVHWHPWGAAAFEESRLTGKPVLLSIGYSACHWCHVMAHESFEDPGTAAVMNELFVSIKVDREERPDLDRIYQLAHQLLVRRGGGWPLTMFLDHEQRPFFGGTYFPPAPRQGMPDFRTVLRRVAQYHHERRDELAAQTQAVVSAMAAIDAPIPSDDAPLTDAPLRLLRAQLEQRFDRTHGGFGPPPRFPHAGMLARLLRDWHASAAGPSPDLQALFMATLSLTRMAQGGLHDQLGGGFYRYSVDERWEIPHFEKMLYDNGALLSVYADAATATGDATFAAVAAQTAAFLLREMLAPGGAFHSSFDADSDGREGAYYVWTPAQVTAALGDAAAPLFIARHGLDLAPNFEGSWHLVAARGIDELAQQGGLAAAEISRGLEFAREQLLKIRAARTAPALDDKVLTGWNALAIKGLADASRALGRDDLAQAAAAALAWLRRHHWRDGRLLAASKDGEARLPAYLDDHALLLDAILSLLTVHFDAGALQFACELSDALLQRFEDPQHGGFYFTAHDHEALIHRSRSFSDDATPSGNAIAASCLQKLGWLLGNGAWLAAAERALRAAWPTLVGTPLAQVHMATALEEHLHPHTFVILRGEPAPIGIWRQQLQRVWRPRVSIIAIAHDMSDLPPALATKKATGEAVAYVCRGSVCAAPEHSLGALLKTLSRD